MRLRSRRGALEMTVTRAPAHAAGLQRQRQRVPAGLRRPPHAARSPPSCPASVPRGDGKARVNDAPGYQIKYRAGTEQRPLTGIDILVVPEDGRRDGVVLRYRQTNPPRPLDDADRDLVKATRKAFRSFRFGLDRP